MGLLNLSLAQRSRYVELCLERGDAPVRPESLQCVCTPGKGFDHYRPLRDVLCPPPPCAKLTANDPDEGPPTTINKTNDPSKLVEGSDPPGNPLLAGLLFSRKRQINETERPTDDLQCPTTKRHASDTMKPVVNASGGETRDSEGIVVSPHSDTLQHRQKLRGQNKGRRVNISCTQGLRKDHFCPLVASTSQETCDRGDHCQMLHDRQAFMQVRRTISLF